MLKPIFKKLEYIYDVLLHVELEISHLLQCRLFKVLNKGLMVA